MLALSGPEKVILLAMFLMILFAMTLRKEDNSSKKFGFLSPIIGLLFIIVPPIVFFWSFVNIAPNGNPLGWLIFIIVIGICTICSVIYGVVIMSGDSDSEQPYPENYDLSRHPTVKAWEERNRWEEERIKEAEEHPERFYDD